jgi:Leucine-rich repeat (LRR) protein
MQLRHLDCSNTMVQDLAPLFRLGRLQFLDVSSTRVGDLTPLKELTALEFLSCMNTLVRELEPISELKRLEFLNISITKVHDLDPLKGLNNLNMLFLWKTRVINLAPLKGLKALRDLDLDDTGVSDLSPLIELRELSRLSVKDCRIKFLPAGIERLQELTSLNLRGNKLRELPKELGGLSALEQGARSGSLGGGLWLDGNPLEYPLPDLIAPGQPKATINVLRWLRGEPISSGTEASDPPAIPEQGAGPRVVLDPTGRLVFAKPADLDAKGNDRNRLEALHPALREAASALAGALQDQSSNLRNERLLQKAEAYRALVDVPLEEVDFARLYAAGMQLLNAAGATRKALETGRADVPDLTPIQDECLANIENLHPPFVLASREGQEMLADQTTIKLTAEAVEGIKEAGTELGEELINHPDLADREVGEIIRDAAAEIGQGENDARDAVNTVSTMRNAVIVLATASKWAAIPTAVGYVAGGLAVAGTAAGATLWWFGTKVAEKTKAFQTDVERVQKALSTEANKLSGIRNRIEGHQSLLLKVEPKLRKITQLPGFTWLGPSLDLLKRKSSGDKEQ